MKQHTSTSRDASNFSAAFYAVPHTARTQLLVSAPLLLILLPSPPLFALVRTALYSCLLASLLSAATTAHSQVAVSFEMGDQFEVSCCHAGIGVLEASIARYFLYCLCFISVRIFSSAFEYFMVFFSDVCI